MMRAYHFKHTSSTIDVFAIVSCMKGDFKLCGIHLMLSLSARLFL